MEKCDVQCTCRIKLTVFDLYRKLAFKKIRKQIGYVQEHSPVSPVTTVT